MIKNLIQLKAESVCWNSKAAGQPWFMVPGPSRTQCVMLTHLFHDSLASIGSMIYSYKKTPNHDAKSQSSQLTNVMLYK